MTRPEIESRSPEPLANTLPLNQWAGSRIVVTHSCRDKEVHAFPKGISLKVNVIVQLEFEFVYYDLVIQHFNHYAGGTLLNLIFQTIYKVVMEEWFVHMFTHSSQVTTMTN